MAIKIFILDSDGGLDKIFGDIFDFYWGSILVGIDFVQEGAVSIENFSTDGGGVFGETAGVGNIFENINE